MKKILGILVGLAILGAGGYFAYSYFTQPPPEPPYVVPGLTKEYKNDAHAFSLKMPETFEARSTTDENRVETIVLEDKVPSKSPVGVQITITPFDEDLKVLTADRVKQDVPDLAISDIQTIEIGDEYKGLAFKSDNEAFDGASREVWFVFRQNLYQISTYERLDPLLQAIFGTWQF